MKDNAQLIVSEYELPEYVTDSRCYPTTIVIGFRKDDKDIISVSTVENCIQLANSLLKLCKEIEERYGHHE